MAFFGWFVRYLLVFAVLAGVGALGIFTGKKMSDKKSADANAKK